MSANDIESQNMEKLARNKFPYQAFSDGVQHGTPETFGIYENLYASLLSRSGLGKRLKNLPNPNVLMVGSTPESLEEFIRFIKGYNQNANMLVLEISDIGVEKLRKKLVILNELDNNRIHLIQGDGLYIGLDSSSIDIVFTHWLLHNLSFKDIEESRKLSINFLRETYRVLRPKGGIVLVENSIFDNPPQDWSKPPIPYSENIKKAIKMFESLPFRSVHSKVGKGITRKEYLQKHGIYDGSLDIRPDGYAWWPEESVGAYAIK